MRRALTLVCLLLAAAPARAQSLRDVPSDLWNAAKQQAAPEGLATAGATGALFALARPQDTTVKDAVLGPPAPIAPRWADAGQWAGNAGVLFGVAGVLYGAGWAAGSSAAAEAGLSGLEGLALAGIETEALKYAASRRRPDGSDRQSFPSGHASESFALATTLVSQFGWAAAPAYVGAGFIGYTRLQKNKHWLSDVVAGAGLGIWCGRAVSLSRARRRDGIALRPWILPGGAGALASAAF